MAVTSLPESLTKTPMLRQFISIKKDYTDAILFFRLGDFYEMFLEDAIIASKELDLTLTGRGKDENRVPMCGVPYHAAESYISKLVERGFKVAICEQVENASDSKGITKRDVVRVVTPGTVIDHDQLDASSNNYLVGIMSVGGKYGMSYIDISTGEFRLLYCDDLHTVYAYINKLRPKEVLQDASLTIELDDSMVINTPHLLDKKRAEEEFLSHFSLSSITAFGLDAYRDILPIAWAILSYVKSTQKSQLSQVTKCLPLRHEHTMSIDKVSIRNLDLISSSMTQKKTGSLFWVLDTTKTAMGARKLKFLIQNPSTDIRQINQRLDAVSALKEDLLSREELRDTLQYVYDLERLLSRIVSHRHNPKDCIALRDSLGSLEEMSGILSHFQHTPLLDSYADFFSSFSDKNSCYYLLHTLLKNSIVDSPPSHIRDGNIIKKGFNDELDALNFSFKSIRDWIDTLEEKERQSTGIKGLKVGFNKVFGYFFNIPNGSKHLVPEHYIRKQTLANAERYITPELKEKEIVLLNGEEKRIALESRIYVDIVATIQRSIRELQQLAEIIAQLDCLQSFASVSQKYNYTRPTFVESEHAHLSLNDSRHPVLEKQAESPVIPNTFSLSESESSFMLITGPNMAGKSTFMRQVALIVIMAQIGCFVPASAASLSICDKIFTRIGALDNLYSGQSTFMVEMLETSTILHNATSKSLILLDEIGRGTSTYDGMSIAGAITEYIHTRIGARTMFATHYHELTQLSQSLTNLSNYSMAIKEDGESIFFTYSLVEGPADKSYGIHVAQMAGLPGEVLERAKTLLKNYESL